LEQVTTQTVLVWEAYSANGVAYAAGVVTHFGGSVTTGGDKSGEDSSLCSSMKALSRWL